MTLREALIRAAAALATKPDLRANANRDAELLLLHILEAPRTLLITDPGRALTPIQQRAYQAAIARRLTHEPIQYITGQQEFYGLALRVTPAVLIPRPETEHLVEAVLEHLLKARLPKHQPLSIADVGTGSGAIAIALATHLPQSEITALDLSPEALGLARENAAQHNLAHRIRFVESDLLAAVAHQTFDAIVSNPPYVPIIDRATLHPQVRDHEPAHALFAGPTGLDVYRRLIPQAQAALKPGGLLALELGQGQGDALAALLSNWRDVTFVDDLQQIPRVALAIRP